MTKNTSSLDLRTSITSDEYRIETQSRTQALLESWFSQEWIDKISTKTNNITLWKSPSEKIDELKTLGFTNPIKLITSSPAILGYSIEDNIKPKITELKTLGFTNPIKVITSSPPILGYSIEDNIKPKITELKTLGFTNPIKLITSSPTILNLSIENNIKPKVKIAKKIIWNDKVAIDLLEKAPEIIGTKIDKSWTILRWLKMLWLLNEEIITYYKSINIGESESFIIAVDSLRWEENVTITQLRREIKKYKKIWDKKKRKEVILWENEKERTSEYLSPKEKLLHRYSRWYWPKK